MSCGSNTAGVHTAPPFRSPSLLPSSFLNVEKGPEKHRFGFLGGCWRGRVTGAVDLPADPRGQGPGRLFQRMGSSGTMGPSLGQWGMVRIVEDLQGGTSAGFDGFGVEGGGRVGVGGEVGVEGGFLFWPIHPISPSFCWACPAPRCPYGLEAQAGVKGSLDPQKENLRGGPSAHLLL